VGGEESGGGEDDGGGGWQGEVVLFILVSGSRAFVGTILPL